MFAQLSKNPGVSIYDYLVMRGLPTNGYTISDFAYMAHQEGSPRAALRELLLRLRVSAYRSMYGNLPNPAVMASMRQHSEEDAAKADLGDA